MDPAFAAGSVENKLTLLEANSHGLYGHPSQASGSPSRTTQSQQQGWEKKRQQTTEKGDNDLKELFLNKGHPAILTSLNQLSEEPVKPHASLHRSDRRSKNAFPGNDSYPKE
jgi:hypothetical protein